MLQVKQHLISVIHWGGQFMVSLTSSQLSAAVRQSPMPQTAPHTVLSVLPVKSTVGLENKYLCDVFILDSRLIRVI